MAISPAEELEALKAALTALEPLEQDRRAWAVGWLGEALAVSTSPESQHSPPSPAATPQPPTPPAAGEGAASGMSPKQFIARKRPSTDVERVACLAYYLTHDRKTPHFKTNDLATLNTEAAAPKFSNPSAAAQNALNQNRYLAQAGKGQRQIAPLGESIVEALPDRDAVKEILAKAPRKRAKKTARRTKARKTS